MLMLVCLSLVASALAQLPVPGVSAQTHCMAQCMLLPPAQKRGCIEMCGAEAGAGKPSWINRPLETNWRNFEDKSDTTWFPTGAAIDQVPAMWESSKFTEECESRCVKLPYPFSVECSAQCPRLNDFGTSSGSYGLPTGRDFEASRACFNKCYERGNNTFYCAKVCHNLLYT